MNKATIINSLSKTFSKTKFKIKKHSPEILIAVGIGGVITSTVIACRATTKLNPILEESREKIDDIKCCDRNPEDQGIEKKEVAMVYAQTGVRVVKLYAPSVILGTMSIASILASNNILRKRNAALAAAYATLDRGFQAYRSRVAERFGEEVEKEIRYNTKTCKIEETVADENGKEKKVKKTIGVTDICEVSDYARYFDRYGSKLWETDPSYNMTLLKAQQNYANNILQTQRSLYLNDVYKMCGIKKSKAGQIVGWNLDSDEGDNFVDLRIQESYRYILNEETGEMEPMRTIIIDPNCQGNIWKDMPEDEE